MMGFHVGFTELFCVFWALNYRSQSIHVHYFKYENTIYEEATSSNSNHKVNQEIEDYVQITNVIHRNNVANKDI